MFRAVRLKGYRGSLNRGFEAPRSPGRRKTHVGSRSFRYLNKFSIESKIRISVRADGRSDSPLCIHEKCRSPDLEQTRGERAMIAHPSLTLDPVVADEAPSVANLTDYDFTMLECYLRLLDAESEGADWREVAQIVLKVDADNHYARAKKVYDSHIARARWMTKEGFRQLLKDVGPEC